MQQAQKGEWNYQLQPVYMISLLDFKFDDHLSDVLHSVQLKNQHNQIFYDKLSFMYVILPHFNKTEDELLTNADKWLYLFKHMAECEEVPTVYRKDGNGLFNQAFEKSRVAKLNHAEQAQYRDSLKERWDWQSIIDTAKEESLAEGLAEGEMIGLEKGKLEEKHTIARGLMGQGVNVSIIMTVTGLSEDDIKRIIGNVKS
jgi:predicted transposase/invertase (TIGR01784 family)